MTQRLRFPIGFWVGLVILLLLVLLAVVGPMFAGDLALAKDPLSARQGSSPEHLLGTDEQGRDVLARVIAGSGPSLLYAITAAALGAAAGVLAGSLAALLPARFGRGFTTAVDIAVGFPGILVALFLAALLGPGSWTAVAAMAVAFTPLFARLTITLAAGVAASDYVSAARLLGVRRGGLMLTHVVPNIAEPLLVTFTVAIGQSFVGLAGLSFLGLGTQPPEMDWGQLMSSGFPRIYRDPEVVAGPALMIVLAGLSFVLAGEGWMARSSGGSAVAERPAVRADAPELAGHAFVVGETALSVRDLRVAYRSGERTKEVVHGVSFDIGAGEIVGIVGESGSGKTQTVLGAVGLLETPAEVSSSGVRIAGVDPATLSGAEADRFLGTTVGLVGQNPMSSLNPLMRIGELVAETGRVHGGASRAEGHETAVEALRGVGIADPELRVDQHPHQLSGGMRQRALIAAATATVPRLLIADEPTTALDVTVQQRILDLLTDLRDESGMAMVFISHDINVVASICSRVLVMLRGEIVDAFPIGELRDPDRHPYTRALLECVPGMDTDRDLPLPTIPTTATRAPERENA